MSKESDIRDVEILQLWKKRFSPQQIAEEIGETLAFVRRRLKVVQKTIVDNEKGAENHETKIHI
jgi:uncharacterized protein YfkK (UPF0435 family)